MALALHHERGRVGRARGRRGVPARADRARGGPDGGLPAARDGPAQPRELPDARGHQGRARGPGCRGPRRLRLWSAPCPGPGRRPGGGARLLRGRLQLHLQLPRRQDLRHPGLWHARPLVGHVVSHRARRLPCLRALQPQELRAARRYLRRAPGPQECRDRGQGDGGGRRAPRGRAHRLGRPRQALQAGAQDVRRGGPALRAHLGLQ